MTEETETIITEEEDKQEPIIPTEEEEEKPDPEYEHRENVINSTPQSYEEWVAYVNNIEVSIPEIEDIDLGDTEEIYKRIPSTIDATKYIYDTRLYRYRDLVELSKDTYDKYKKDYENIQTKYNNTKATINDKYDKLKEDIETASFSDEEKQTLLKTNEEERQKELAPIIQTEKNEIKTLNEDYLQKSFTLALKLKELKENKNQETGFVGDVYIDGKLNNREIDEFATKREIEESENRVIARIDDFSNDVSPKISFFYSELNSMINSVNEKLDTKIDKELFGISSEETLINKIYYYNKFCCSLNEHSNKISVVLLPLVDDDQYYYIVGYLYIKNYWNSEVVYSIQAHAINKEVEVIDCRVIRSNGSKWNPLDGLRKITQGDNTYAGVVIESEDAYNWNVFYSGYFHDVNTCKILKEDDFSESDVFTNVSNTTLNETINTLKEDIDTKLETISNKFNEYTNTKTLDTKLETISNKFNEYTNTKTLDTKLADKANKTHTHTMDEITNLAFPIPSVDEIVGLQSELTSLSMRINEGQDMVMDSVEMNYAKLGHTHEINDINNLMSTIEERVNAVLSYINTNYWKTIYPIGSVYISMDPTHPRARFGGTLEQDLEEHGCKLPISSYIVQIIVNRKAVIKRLLLLTYLRIITHSRVKRSQENLKLIVK